MSPTLATLLTASGVLFLLWWEARHGEAREPALWIPTLWICIAGSRFVSQWMNLGNADTNVTEGSPLDAAIFSALMLSALWVLSRRSIGVVETIRANPWIAALLIYSLLSTTWSDEPTIAIKRWVKALGHPLVVLVILSDPDPKAALRTTLKRCAYFLLPVSVLFLKYLPEYGRSFDEWSGGAVNNGVGIGKNDLGCISMILCIIFVWNLYTLDRLGSASTRRAEETLSLAFILMSLWLLRMSNSATSMAALVVASAALLAVRSRWVSKRYFGSIALLVLLAAALLDYLFNLHDQVVLMLGRDLNLTDRTEVWQDVLEMQSRPLIGYGFESFWLGVRMELLWEKWWWRPTQAHNGYIETYLNLGLIGVGLLACALLSVTMRVRRELVTDLDLGSLRLALLLAVLLFNYTEAAFKAVHFMWTIF